MNVYDFANQCAAYLMGCEHGNGGTIPQSIELRADQQEVIARAVAYGALAALAMNEDKTTLALDCRDQFNRITQKGESTGMTYGQIDLAYQIGYNRARSKE